MDESTPTGADALNAASDSCAVPCPEPPMPIPSASQVAVRLKGHSRFGDIPCDFIYDSRDPHAIKVIFHQGAKFTEWAFARSLLVDALAGNAGTPIGDVRVERLQEEVVVTLHPETGDSFSFTFARLGIAAFVNKTTSLVMVGAESYDTLDAEIAELLA